MGFFKEISKPFKKAAKEVKRAATKVDKKVTGGAIRKGLKKSGIGKAGQDIINASPHKIGQRIARGENLKNIAKDAYKGNLLRHATKAGPISGGLAAKMLGDKNSEGLSGDVDAGETGKEFDKGVKFSDKILGPEGLRTQEMKDVMAMRKKQATEGISPEQQLAMKTKMAKQMMQAEQAAGLKLGSALGGVRGASAGSQVRSLQAQGLQARAGIERDMFMAQEAAKQQGINALEDTARFDVGQIGKEKELRATVGMSFEALQAQRDAAALSAQATRDAAPKDKNFLQSLPIIGDIF